MAEQPQQQSMPTGASSPGGRQIIATSHTLLSPGGTTVSSWKKSTHSAVGRTAVPTAQATGAAPTTAGSEVRFQIFFLLKRVVL